MNVETVEDVLIDIPSTDVIFAIDTKSNKAFFEVKTIIQETTGEIKPEFRVVEADIAGFNAARKTDTKTWAKAIWSLLSTTTDYRNTVFAPYPALENVVPPLVSYKKTTTETQPQQQETTEETTPHELVTALTALEEWTQPPYTQDLIGPIPKDQTEQEKPKTEHEKTGCLTDENLAYITDSMLTIANLIGATPKDAENLTGTPVDYVTVYLDWKAIEEKYNVNEFSIIILHEGDYLIRTKDGIIIIEKEDQNDENNENLPEINIPEETKQTVSALITSILLPTVPLLYTLKNMRQLIKELIGWYQQCQQQTSTTTE